MDTHTASFFTGTFTSSLLHGDIEANVMVGHAARTTGTALC